MLFSKSYAFRMRSTVDARRTQIANSRMVCLAYDSTEQSILPYAYMYIAYRRWGVFPKPGKRWDAQHNNRGKSLAYDETRYISYIFKIMSLILPWTWILALLLSYTVFIFVRHIILTSPGKTSWPPQKYGYFLIQEKTILSSPEWTVLKYWVENCEKIFLM